MTLFSSRKQPRLLGPPGGYLRNCFLSQIAAQAVFPPLMGLTRCAFPVSDDRLLLLDDVYYELLHVWAGVKFPPLEGRGLERALTCRSPYLFGRGRKRCRPCGLLPLCPSCVATRAARVSRLVLERVGAHKDRTGSWPAFVYAVHPDQPPPAVPGRLGVVANGGRCLLAFPAGAETPRLAWPWSHVWKVPPSRAALAFALARLFALPAGEWARVPKTEKDAARWLAGLSRWERVSAAGIFARRAAYSGPSGPEVEARPDGDRPAAWARQIQDNGVGFVPECVLASYDPLGRLDHEGVLLRFRLVRSGKEFKYLGRAELSLGGWLNPGSPGLKAAFDGLPGSDGPPASGFLSLPGFGYLLASREDRLPPGYDGPSFRAVRRGRQLLLTPLT